MNADATDDSRLDGGMTRGGIAVSEAHLWLLPWDSLADLRPIESCRPLLDEAERRQSGRFRFPESRQEYEAAHVLLRIALSCIHHASPQSWRFRSGGHGRPEIAGPADAPALRFSLSHTRGLAACLIAAGREVGVDVEALGADLSDTAERFLTPKELAACEGLPPAERTRRLYEYWTLKEAYAKACGRGLSLPLTAIGFDLGPGPRARVWFDERVRDDAAAWQFLRSEPVPGRLLAVAVRRGDDQDVAVVRHPLTAEILARLA